MKSLLITFGCSWTFGVGLGYQPGMTIEQYKSISQDKNLADKLSYRSILSKDLDLDNLSFAEGGSSNQKQFRLAKTFFPTAEFNNYSNVIVLWGITATLSNELFLSEQNELVSFKYHQKKFGPVIDTLFKWSYNHDHEVSRLATEMLFWNDYFKSKNIKNLWIDMFNHHNYPTSIPNLVGDDKPHRDMLSQLALINGQTDLDNNYHASSWCADTNRIPGLVDRGLLNPFSNHPTVSGHQQIANLLKNHLENLL